MIWKTHTQCKRLSHELLNMVDIMLRGVYKFTFILQRHKNEFLCHNTNDSTSKVFFVLCPQILSEDSSVQVGSITKQWRGLCAEAFTDADNFGLTFPADMEVRTKALLLGALFLIVSLPHCINMSKHGYLGIYILALLLLWHNYEFP